MAFGLTTILLNFHNAGFYPLDSMILAMGIFYGGIAQVIAGILESRKNNTFGLTAFTSYGFFWLSLAFILIIPKLGWTGPVHPTALVVYLSIWGIFTLLLFFVTLKISRALQIIFASLTLLFFLLAIGDASENKTITHIAGLEGILCGSSAIYAGIAQLINEVYGKEVLPLGIIRG
jgi:succinate-acetate transporter protein